MSRAVAKHQVRIFHRFPFSSSLKRMTCLIVLAHESQPTLRVVSKGAAEVMASKFAVVCAPLLFRHLSLSSVSCHFVLGCARAVACRVP